MTLGEIGVAPEYQWLATAAGAIVIGALAAWGRYRGKTEGPPKPVVTEFAVSGTATISDMKPIRDLVDAVLKLVAKIDQQVEADGRTAAALEGLAAIYAEQIEAQKDEDRIKAEIERRWSLIEATGRAPRPRAPRARKTSGSP